MITKILVEIIKRNKMKLKSATTGDNFRLAICNILTISYMNEMTKTETTITIKKH